VRPGGCVAFASVGAAEGEIVVAVEPTEAAARADLSSGDWRRVTRTPEES